MPFVPTAIQGFMQAKGASKALSGSKFPGMASSIGSAASAHVLSSATVTSTNIVAGPGAGVQIGRVVGVVASAMSAMMVGKAGASGLAGRDLAKIMDSVAFAVTNALNAVVQQGSVVGGGPGTGTGKIAGLVPSSLKGLIQGLLGAQAIAGSKTGAIADAMAFGICNHIMANATVSITDVGAAAPPPAGTVTLPVAPGTGRLV